jgi:hypothetical protein
VQVVVRNPLRGFRGLGISKAPGDGSGECFGLH